MLPLANYSRTSLAELRAETGITYDERMLGTLQLFRTQQQLDASAKDVKALAADGVPYKVVDPDGCIRVEPALARVREKIVGGLLTPRDETGDCYKFASALADKAQSMGVVFEYGRVLKRIVVEGGEAMGVETGLLRSGAVVVALGSFSPLMVGSLGIRLPVYPVKGYSLTMPIIDPLLAPESTVMDETFKIAVTRLGDRIRVGGMAEISGYANGLGAARRRTLEHSVSDLFPGGDLARASLWCGLRPMTPDGTPVIGPTRHRNLFLNTGSQRINASFRAA